MASNKKNKDIYEVFNEINFEESEFDSIELDDIEKKKLKKQLRLRISDSLEFEKQNKFMNDNIKNTHKGWIKVACIAVLIVVLGGITPIGKEVLAQIKDKLFFIPSKGIINENQWGNTYILDKPEKISIKNKNIIIKSIVNSGEYISIEMWEEESINNTLSFQENHDEILEEMKSNFKLKTIDGRVLLVEGYALASGGYASISFNQGNDNITEFDLYYGEDKLGHFILSQVKYIDNYDDIGGNDSNNGVLIGATSYYVEGDRYFKLWSNKDNVNMVDYRVDIDKYNEVEARDDKGNILRIESANDGTGKAYKLLDDYYGNIYLNINEIDLRYELNEGANISLKLPKEGEAIKVDKELKLKGLEDRLVVKSIINNNGQYENGDYVVKLDYSNNYDNNRFIYMANESIRNNGAIGDPENKSSEIYLYNEDLSLIERLTRRINLRLDRILLRQYGNWNFVIE